MDVWIDVLPLALAGAIGALAGALLQAWATARRERRRAKHVRPPVSYLPPLTELPARPPTPQPVPRETVRARRLDSANGPSVLLVDDQIAALGLHAAYLRSHGYTVLLAENGLAGIERAREHHPDVIVLDYSMGDLNGADVAKRLKADPNTADIPIVLLTAMPYGAVGPAARAAGCVGFLSKPVELSRLLREVESFTRPSHGHA